MPNTDYITSSSDIPLLKTKLEQMVDDYDCLQWNEEHTQVDIILPMATQLWKKGIHSIKRSWFVDGSSQETDFLAFNAAILDNLFSIVESGTRDVNLETGEYGPNDPLTIALADPTKQAIILSAYPRTPVDVDGEMWTPPELGYCNHV